MCNVTSYLPLIKKIFWFLNIPFFCFSVGYVLLIHQNPIESPLCYVAIFLCFPYLLIRSDELREKGMNESFNSWLEKFSQMNDVDFIEFKKQFKFIPLGHGDPGLKAAYTAELERRFGHSRHIND